MADSSEKMVKELLFGELLMLGMPPPKRCFVEDRRFGVLETSEALTGLLLSRALSGVLEIRFIAKLEMCKD